MGQLAIAVELVTRLTIMTCLKICNSSHYHSIMVAL